MVLEYDEKGKFYTDIIKKEEVFAHIQTIANRIMGYIHIRIGDRLSDEINQEKLFLAVTGAEIYDLAGGLLYTSDFLAVNRQQIVWLMPVEGQKEQAGKRGE